MLLNRLTIFPTLTICLLVSVSGCGNNPTSKELEQIFAADPLLKNNPPFSQLTQTPTQNNQQPEKPVQLPADFALQIPPYPNSQLIDKSEQGEKTLWNTSDPINLVENFYQTEFQEKNWEIISRPTETGEGSLVAKKDNLQVTVYVKPIQTPEAATEYAIEYQWQNEEVANVPPPPVISDAPPTPFPQTEPSPSLTPSPEALPTPTLLPSPEAAALPTAPPTPFSPSGISPVPMSTTPESTVLKKALKDVPSGLRPYVSDLSKLGLFEGQQAKYQINPDATTPLSEPQNIVTRRVYAKWLVNANNQILGNNPGQQIRLAGSNETPIFEDVPKNDPDFNFIQGLAEAGLIPSPLSGDTNVVKFRPDEPLVREDLILWKVPLDIRKPLPNATVEQVKSAWDFQDTSKIDPAALRAVLADYENGDFSNIRRVFGYTRLFRPDKAVSRAEAAAALWYFGEKEQGMSAQKVLEAKQQS
ncbi:MAG: S-layer homology domain-containing protein [Microcoleaceae cyanobacterium MO_207.B10]|nr:S-layer homology domain-containing protein [Microcoleaceae cyanobacterium MO_207.B10]